MIIIVYQSLKKKTDKKRKKREELSVNAIKTFKKEKVEITVTFN